ncbi:MAG: ABC transporter permease [Saprospiraceae bacterium]|nr:ABC transporter permease [Lewinella sp.]
MFVRYAFTRSLLAESLKLKGTPILWLVLSGGVFIAGFIFLLHFFNVEKFTEQARNPWDLYFELSFMMTAMLFLVPYIVLIAGAVVYPEHNGNAWKQLYSLPIRRGNIYFSKLLTILGLIALTYLIFFVIGLIGAYLLDFIFPAFGFRKYPPDIGGYALRLLHSYIAILGILGLHYWFSVRWSSFILPMGIGLLGFIIAIFVIFIGNRFDLGTYFPYTYPMVVGAEFGNKPLGLEKMAGLLTVEWGSIGLFIVSSLVGFYEEKLKNVK